MWLQTHCPEHLVCNIFCVKLKLLGCVCHLVSLSLLSPLKIASLVPGCSEGGHGDGEEHQR